MTAFSYQLYSSRNFQPLERTFSMLSELGYTRVEGYGGLYNDLSSLKSALDKFGISMPTGHFGLDMLENEVARVLDVAKAVGIKAIFCPYLAAENRPTTPEGWKSFAQRLYEIGAPYRAAGYRFGWHNHDFEFHPLSDGSTPMQHILDVASDMAWEADIAWIIRGNADPVEWINRYRQQIIAVHVKDIAVSGQKTDEDGWDDVGHGTVNWPALFEVLRDTSTEYFVMEHDNPADDRRFASRSLESARKF